GRADQFVTDYQSRDGRVPFDVWGIHVYQLNWKHPLPMIDAPGDQAQLIATRQWLDAKGLALPIWLTEFGVLWAYDGVDWQPLSYSVRCTGPDQGRCAVPVGPRRTDLLNDYLDQMFRWLTTTGQTRRIERWFVLADHPQPEWWGTGRRGI